jgi:hypothetical protein
LKFPDFFGPGKAFGVEFAPTRIDRWVERPIATSRVVDTQRSLIMYGRHSFTAFLASSLLLLGHMIPVSASTLSLDTGKSLVLQPGETGFFTFSFTNNGPEITEGYIGWNMGVQFIPDAGATGTLTIGEVTQPSVNPMPAGTFDKLDPSFATLASGAEINGLTTYYNSSITANDVIQTLAANTQYNAGSYEFTASPDASGTWTVYAVQQQGTLLLKTYWFDQDLSDVAYTNFPFMTGGNYALALGTISVVPEPSSFVLAGSAIAMLGWYAARKRRTVAVMQA